VLEFAESMELEASLEAVATARPRLVYSDPPDGRGDLRVRRPEEVQPKDCGRKCLSRGRRGGL